MVERSLAWLVRKGHRRVAYRGVDRNRICLSHRVAAVDLRRLRSISDGCSRWAFPDPRGVGRGLRATPHWHSTETFHAFRSLRRYA